jgi:vancomycin permeability regulator SanA
VKKKNNINEKTTRGIKKIFLKILLFSGIAAVLGIIAFAAVQIIIVQSTKGFLVGSASAAPECDAVMVLGAMVYSSGAPSQILRDRLDFGYELYAEGKAKKILVSGDHGQSNYDEVNVMKNYLLDKGVPREDIFMDHAGFNTYDSMYRAKNIFYVGSLLISTQDFHINRAVYIARSLGIDAYGYPCEDKSAYRMNYFYRRESLARVKAFWDTIVKRAPAYLGETVPISGDGGVTDG